MTDVIERPFGSSSGNRVARLEAGTCVLVPREGLITLSPIAEEEEGTAFVVYHEGHRCGSVRAKPHKAYGNGPFNPDDFSVYWMWHVYARDGRDLGGSYGALRSACQLVVSEEERRFKAEAA